MRFRGEFRAVKAGAPGVESVAAPTIVIHVELLGRSAAIEFDVDTGSTVTVLSDSDASRLLGDEHRLLQYRADAQRIGLRGLTGLTTGTVLEARLTLRSEEGQYSLNQPIVIPPPQDRTALSPLPSLLGRDMLRHVRLELVYGDAPSVLLETL